MKKLFFFLLNLISITIYSQQSANPVSVQTVKQCIDEYSLNDFKGVKGDSLYGSERNNDSDNYWSRYKCQFLLGSDSSFVLYLSVYDRHNLEFFYGFDSDAEEKIFMVINEVVEYYVKKDKWKKSDELEDPFNGLQLRDTKGRIRLKFRRDNKLGISMLEIFSVKDQ